MGTPGNQARASALWATAVSDLKVHRSSLVTHRAFPQLQNCFSNADPACYRTLACLTTRLFSSPCRPCLLPCSRLLACLSALLISTPRLPDDPPADEPLPA
ncbi:unnamed protein product [Boreogadus saida]